jgi:hypothetical protein
MNLCSSVVVYGTTVSSSSIWVRLCQWSGGWWRRVVRVFGWSIGAVLEPIWMGLTHFVAVWMEIWVGWPLREYSSNMRVGLDRRKVEDRAAPLGLKKSRVMRLPPTHLNLSTKQTKKANPFLQLNKIRVRAVSKTWIRDVPTHPFQPTHPTTKNTEKYRTESVISDHRSRPAQAQQCVSESTSSGRFFSFSFFESTSLVLHVFFVQIRPFLGKTKKSYICTSGQINFKNIPKESASWFLTNRFRTSAQVPGVLLAAMDKFYWLPRGKNELALLRRWSHLTRSSRRSSLIFVRLNLYFLSQRYFLWLIIQTNETAHTEPVSARPKKQQVTPVPWERWN